MGSGDAEVLGGSMATFIDRPRWSCALGGALFTLRGLRRVVPIIHASPGCGYNVYAAGSAGSGHLGGGYCGGSAWSSSNVGETEIVFGGSDRLKEQIRTTLEVVDGDLYVVLSGCMVELIGDDINQAAGDAAVENPGASILAVSTPGFTDRRGYDLVMAELFKSHTIKGLAKKNPRSLTFWA
jgi:nitrogenase molybdenum-iron protein beta chain